MEELVKELFKQLRNETPQKFFSEKVAEKNKPTTRWSQKGLFSSTYCRTVVERKSLGNTLRKAFNWLMWMNLLPENIESFSKVQLRKYTKNLTDLYIADNKHLYPNFFLGFKVKRKNYIQFVIIGSRGKDSKSMYAHSLSFLDVLD